MPCPNIQQGFRQSVSGGEGRCHTPAPLLELPMCGWMDGWTFQQTFYARTSAVEALETRARWSQSQPTGESRGVDMCSMSRGFVATGREVIDCNLRRWRHDIDRTGAAGRRFGVGLGLVRIDHVARKLELANLEIVSRRIHRSAIG